MNPLAHFIVAAAIGASSTAAQAQESKAILRQVEERLLPILSELTPTPTVECLQSSQSLGVYYRPQKFFVHGRSPKTGEWLTNLVEQLGPSSTGFVLWVQLQERGVVNQLLTPQTTQGPYWQTHLDVTLIDGTTNQIFWALSFAGRTDEEVLASMRHALESLSGPGPKAKAEPTGPANGSQPSGPDSNRTSAAAGSRR